MSQRWEAQEEVAAAERPSVMRPALFLLSLALLIILFFHKLALSNLILARGDTFLYFYPYWEAAAEALRSGRTPLWNPALFMGAPFLANSQVGVFYPLNWPLWRLLSTPYAVSASIILHLFIATAGVFFLARRALRLPYAAAWLAALLFSLGGYLTAQVEHVNQLQGLAWLPWLLLVVDGRRGRGQWLARALLVGFLFALQFLAGHTQTVFISGVAVVVWLVARFLAYTYGAQEREGDWRRGAMMLLPLVVGGVLALGLAAVQLLPTLELTTQSSRAGGLPLNEALSFSLHPLLLGQGLLPHWEQSLFSEYVAFLPLTALLLAAIAAWQGRSRPQLWAPLSLAGAGFLFALGRFNPLYILLANLPGFSYFRAPARWLVLFSLGVALLAAYGWQLVSERRAEDGIEWRRPVLVSGALVAVLIALHFLGPMLSAFVPTGPEAPPELPNVRTLLLWLGEAALAVVALAWVWRRPQARVVFLPLIVLVLFLTSRSLPYNSPTAPAAYLDLRPPEARLLALNDCELLPAQCQQPPGRLLSLSDIFFDPGDLREIESVYGEQLMEQALYDYVIAVKQKEIVAPNLPLARGLASMDGFDGGILPLRSYSRLMSLIVPDGVDPVDGRLREYLTGVPDARWLDLFNVRFLITDKVGDVARRGVFFDLKHPLSIGAGESEVVGYLPDFEATELWLIADEGQGEVVVQTAGGNEWNLQPERIEDDLWRVPFPEAGVATAVQLQAGAAVWVVQGLTMVDSRDGSFQTLVPGQYRLIYSGDVKVYENLDVMPRAYVVREWLWAQDGEEVLSYMSEPQFDPRRMVVLEGDPQAGPEPPLAAQDAEAEVEITHYGPEQVTVNVELTSPGLLVLSDACYPGWQARVDGQGQETPIYRANGLFRAVLLSSGVHEVTFTFEPDSYRWGRAVSAASIALWLLLAGWVTLRRQS